MAIVNLNWQEGKYNGQAKFAEVNRSFEWIPHGKGILQTENGCIEGIWQDGVLIKELVLQP